jgi:dienelactone hydrolase
MSRKICFLVLFSFFFASAFAQPFQIGSRTQTFTDPARANRQIPCDIYYPALTAGANANIASGNFPVVVFGHGFVMTPSAYAVFWNNLVPQGYIVVLPSTESGFSPSHSNFGQDLAFVVGAMKNEGNSSSSPYFNAVSSKSAVMGHSMGGGCSFLAMQFDTTITAMASFAAAVTNPSSVTAATNINKPSIVFSGANDCVAPPPAHQIPMYDSLNSACKSFVSITGGNHCQFAGFNLNCSFGQSTCSPQASISEADQQNLVFTFLLPWLNFYLKNDCNAGPLFQNLISAGNGITSQQNCSLACLPAGNAEHFANNLLSFPNPSSDRLFFKTTNKAAGKICFLTDASGRTILQQKVETENNVLNLEKLSDGIYFLHLPEQPTQKIILQR